jgi:ubiquinone biosynthesis accessory factor UbiJ
MRNLALSGLETAINNVLQYDQETLQRLKKLEGSCIKMEITDWPIELFILPDDHGMQLLATYQEEPTTILKGKLFAMFNIGLQGGDNKALFKHKIAILGDEDVGMAIREILQNIDIDWEEYLSRFTGDTLAHYIASGIGEIKQFTQRSSQVLGQNITDYVQQEAQFFPSQTEAQVFYHRVSELRNDVERLEAWINKMTTKKC